jgi:transcriptional regulator with XRE-family HTH domain
MNYNHFGELLKELRLSRNLTLDQLSEGVCSSRQLSRLEKGEFNPSIYILNQLSYKFNIDLQEYYKITFCDQTFQAYNYKFQCEQAIINCDVMLLRKLIEIMETLQEFQSGENLQYIFYGKALCSSLIDKNYIQSIQYCNSGLLIEDSSFTINTMKYKIYSNVGLTLINCIAGNYSSLHNNTQALKILEDLYLIMHDQINNTPFKMYLSSSFNKKLYQNTTYNLSIAYMNLEQFDKSLDYTEEGISYSLKENYLRFLPELLYQKMRLLYIMEKYSEAKDVYPIYQSFYQLCRSKEENEKHKIEIKENYPLLNINN